MATLLPAHGEPRYIEPANGKAFTAEELHALVGGYFEVLRSEWFVVAATGPGEPLWMFLNEDGKRLDLPVNGFATSLARAGKVLRPGDRIVGDVVLCTLTEAGGDGSEDAESEERPDLQIGDFQVAHAPHPRCGLAGQHSASACQAWRIAARPAPDDPRSGADYYSLHEFGLPDKDEPGSGSPSELPKKGDP